MLLRAYQHYIQESDEKNRVKTVFLTCLGIYQPTRSQTIAPIVIFPFHMTGGVIKLICLPENSRKRFCVPSQFGNRELSIEKGIGNYQGGMGGRSLGGQEVF
jgi:hypothetical protein